MGDKDARIPHQSLLMTSIDSFRSFSRELVVETLEGQRVRRLVMELDF
jgi:hypothetical protein